MDGDYTIPTFPGVMPIGNGGGHHRGLEGKDATLVHGVANLQGHRDLTSDVVGNAKDNAIQTVEAKYQAAENQKLTDIRIEQVAKEQLTQMHVVRRELETNIRNEADKTRDLIRDMDDKRLRDAKDVAFAATLADIQAKLSVLLP